MTYMQAILKDPKTPYLRKELVAVAADMWRAGSSTREIALALRLRESVIYNNLWRVKQ